MVLLPESLLAWLLHLHEHIFWLFHQPWISDILRKCIKLNVYTMTVCLVVLVALKKAAVILMNRDLSPACPSPLDGYFPQSLAGPFEPYGQVLGNKSRQITLSHFSVFHDLLFRHFLPLCIHGPPRKSMVPHILSGQIRRIHANPLNLPFLLRAATGREGPQRVILSEKQ